MDAELKQALADMEGRISRHVDERLATFSRHVDDRWDTVSRHVDERLDIFSRHVDERFELISRQFGAGLENTETRLLTSFHNWAQTYEVRARGTIAAVQEFHERLGFMEERLSKLERERDNGRKN